MRNFTIIIILSLLLILSLFLAPFQAKAFQITFRLAVDVPEANCSVGIRGSVPPLSWEKDYPMSDPDGDGIYEATINFKTGKKNVKYKFLNCGKWELEGNDSRVEWFAAEELEIDHTFNEYNFYKKEKMAGLTYTPEQIKEDVSVLKKTISYIHPNLHKYRSEPDLEKDFEDLEREMLASPDIRNVYKAVSKFASKIQCSHTFTNPWNQGRGVRRAIFYQADKVPFTFSRIGKQLFLDKNASEDQRLERGLEILSINGIQTKEVMTRLAEYTTSDGDNYEKRLERLTINGSEKFALFDVFYSLEFGQCEMFELELKDHRTDKNFTTKINAMAASTRSAILAERYEDLAQTFEDNWKFELLENEVALLKVNSFAVFNKGFDWKKFLDEVFDQLNQNKVQHFIIDIRENEGGETDVAAYILKRILKETISVEAAEGITAYRKIPDELKTHITTWDKKPFDWGMKVKEIGNGRYKVRKLLSGGNKTYKPLSSGYKGNSYLLTGAQNSSATHLMATYVKKYKIATIIGQATGGNQRGLNGGYMFFLRLPNSKVEIDIPVIGTTTQKVVESTPNGGIVPDILVEKNIDDFINEIDTEMEATLRYIKGSEQ